MNLGTPDKPVELTLNNFMDVMAEVNKEIVRQTIMERTVMGIGKMVDDFERENGRSPVEIRITKRQYYTLLVSDPLQIIGFTKDGLETIYGMKITFKEDGEIELI